MSVASDSRALTGRCTAASLVACLSEGPCGGCCCCARSRVLTRSPSLRTRSYRWGRTQRRACCHVATATVMPRSHTRLYRWDRTQRRAGSPRGAHVAGVQGRRPARHVRAVRLGLGASRPSLRRWPVRPRGHHATRVCEGGARRSARPSHCTAGPRAPFVLRAVGAQSQSHSYRRYSTTRRRGHVPTCR